MIVAKLLEFQKLGIVVEKTGTNPHFKSTYATLNEVLAKIKPQLNALGILVLQTPEKDGLRTKLIDTSDNSSVEAFMPYVETTTAQKLGSNNTYNRRYSLVTLLGLEDEDDDGNVASTVKPTPIAQSKPMASPVAKAVVPTINIDEELDEVIFGK